METFLIFSLKLMQVKYIVPIYRSVDKAQAILWVSYSKHDILLITISTDNPFTVGVSAEN